MDLSLRSLAASYGAKAVSALGPDRGRNWPPPPDVSLRSLFTSNQIMATLYSASKPAPFVLNVGPGHEFSDVLLQLCGLDSENAYLAAAQSFRAGGGPAPVYPAITNSGFAQSFAAAIGNASDPAGQAIGDVFRSYDPAQLPILNTLAQEFAVCDHWFASLPGPTWPNRFFAHAASSAGLDHSPSLGEMALWDASGLSFANGSIYDRLNQAGMKWKVYAGDNFPPVLAISGIDVTDINDYSEFAGDIGGGSYDASYTFIEPSYGDFISGSYRCGTSQHPLDDVTRGEALIKATYETLRASPIWNESLLILTWDEHGGFFDHVPPPRAAPPGDTMPGGSYNLYGFAFDRCGPRVPAIVVSPLIPRNSIDHRVYNHASIPATLEQCFGLAPLTARDRASQSVLGLASLATPRADAISVLPPVALSNFTGCTPVSFAARMQGAAAGSLDSTTNPGASADERNLPGFLHIALKVDLALSAPGLHNDIVTRFRAIATAGQAADYIRSVNAKVISENVNPAR
jgi:phospholipase C